MVLLVALRGNWLGQVSIITPGLCFHGFVSQRSVAAVRISNLYFALESFCP